MLTLLNLLAAVALLVWGTHIVRTGFIRVYGANLRRVLAHSVGNRFTAFSAGTLVTGLLQSSTATALLTASFVGQGLVTTSAALAIMLGADVGSGLVAVVLALDLSMLAPVLILVGVILFLSRQSTTLGRLGRVGIGFGLILLALSLINGATRPVAGTEAVRVMFAALSSDLALCVLTAAVLALLFYSSLAVVLLAASLAASDIVSPAAALGLVLGANVGSGILAVLNTLNTSPEARRITVGNLLFRLCGCALVLPWVQALQSLLAVVDGSPAHATVVFHLLFNIALAMLFLPLIEPAARLVERMLPSRARADAVSMPRHLDEHALTTPSFAISCAAREALRIADVVETMLLGMLEVLKSKDRDASRRLRAMDDTVDDLYTAVKLYLVQISRESLDDQEGRRWTDIISFTINLEQVGDIIERILVDIEDKLIKRGTSLSDAGMAEIAELHTRLVANLRLATSVFLNGDLKGAQALVDQKVNFREAQQNYSDSHLQRLAWNTPESIETSSLHLDMITQMKRINSHFCSVAYPILDAAGVLTRSRVVQPPQRGLPLAE